jgi:hypothetical protein
VSTEFLTRYEFVKPADIRSDIIGRLRSLPAARVGVRLCEYSANERFKAMAACGEFNRRYPLRVIFPEDVMP